MKILILTYKFPPKHLSGLELGAHYMAKHLSERGHEVHVVVTRRDAGQSFRQDQEGYHLWRLPVLPVPILRSCFELFFASLLILLIRPNVIHGQALFPCGWLAGLWGKLLSAHSVVYLYGRDVTHPNPILRDFFGGQALRWNKVVLAATKHCQENALKIEKRNISVFYSGFEPPSEWHLQLKDREGILFVGRLEKVKGVDILLKAFAKLENPGTLKIVGQGSEENRLKDLAETLGISEKIDWVNQVPNEDTFSYFSKARVLVLPSREEPYGVVLLEALAAGCRVIGARVGGIPEIIDSEEKGSLTNPENPEDLAAALTQALQGQPLTQEAADHIRSHYSWKSRVDELMTYYES